MPNYGFSTLFPSNREPPNVCEQLIRGVRHCFRGMIREHSLKLRIAGTQEGKGALSWNSGSENLAANHVLMQERLPKSVGRTMEAKGMGGSSKMTWRP